MCVHSHIYTQGIFNSFDKSVTHRQKFKANIQSHPPPPLAQQLYREKETQVSTMKDADVITIKGAEVAFGTTTRLRKD